MSPALFSLALVAVVLVDEGGAAPRAAPPTPAELQRSSLTSAAAERAVEAGLTYLETLAGPILVRTAC